MRRQVRDWLAATIHRHGDLIGAGTIYLGAMALLSLGDVVPGAIRAPAAVLVGVLVPGFAVAGAVIPYVVRGSLRAVISIGVGLALPIVVALVLNLLPSGIEAGAWRLALTALTFGGLAVAAYERRGRTGGARSIPLRRPARVTVATFGAALVVVAIAVFTRVAPGPPDAGSFTELWALEGAGAVSTLEVGIESHEADTTTFRLLVRVGGVDLDPVPISLEPGEIWTRQFELEAANPTEVEATLFRLPDTSEVYRRVSVVASG